MNNLTAYPSDVDSEGRKVLRFTVREWESLQAQLDALQWRPITEQDLPKVGDEVGKYHNGLFLISRISKGWKIEWQIQDGDWTHFRPPNAPPAKP